MKIVEKNHQNSREKVKKFLKGHFKNTKSLQTWIVIITMMYTAVTMATDFSKELAEVKAGTRQEAKASWWGFNKQDATECLQGAINSGVKTLIVDNVGSNWIVTPIKTIDNQTIIFEDGVVLQAKKEEFKGVHDSLLDLSNRKNTTVLGRGKVLFVMNKADYRNAKLYKRGEWRHTLRIFNSENIRVENLILKSSGGDGVYLGASPGKECKNIVLEKLFCEDHYRQGISITGRGQNVLIKDCSFNNTEGTPPQCGLDYEPNYPEGTLINCVFDNCEFNNNTLAGIMIACPHLQETYSLTFKNCKINGNKNGVFVVDNGINEDYPKPGKLEFIDCTFSDNKYESIVISDHRVKKMSLIIKDCTIDNRASGRRALSISSKGRGDLYEITIDGLTVIDDKNLPPVTFLSRLGNAMKNPVIKGVKTRNSKGEEAALNCEKFIKDSQPPPEAKAFKTLDPNLGNLVPLQKNSVIAGEKIRYREKFTYAIFAQKGDNIKIKFTNKPVHRFKGKKYSGPLEVAVFSPTKAPLEILYVPFEETLEYALLANQDGIYTFDADARSQTLTVECNAPGGPLAEESLYLLQCSGIFYFHVPAGIKKIIMEATGVLREESSIWLRNPQGETVASAIKIAGSEILQFSRSDVSKDEIWSIKFSAGKLYLRIGAPLLPVLAPAAENILIAK